MEESIGQFVDGSFARELIRSIVDEHHVAPKTLRAV